MYTAIQFVYCIITVCTSDVSTRGRNRSVKEKNKEKISSSVRERKNFLVREGDTCIQREKS